MSGALDPSAKPRSRCWGRFRPGDVTQAARALAVWFVLVIASQLPAATPDTWLGGTGNWTDKHWSVTTGSGYPNNGSPAGTTYAALIDGGNTVVSDVSLSTSVTVDSLSVSNGDTLEILGSGVLSIPASAGAGTISNAGTIKLFVAGNITAARIVFDGTGVVSPTAILSGGGSIVMASNLSAETLISGATGLETLNNSSTIAGAGEISLLNLVNHGTVNASISGLSLYLAPTSSVINTGTGFAPGGILQATGGGILALAAGTFDNTDPGFPGIISATGASKVQVGLTGDMTTLIKGGTLTTDSSSVIENHGLATLKDLTIAAGSRYLQTDGTTTNLQGTITNGATMVMLSTGASTSTLQLDSGDATLAGNGAVLLYGSPAAGNDPNLVRILSSGGGNVPRLTIGAGQMISGVGQFGNFATTRSPKLTNHGTIAASTLPPNVDTTGITFFPLASADAFINDGTLAASDNNAILTLSGGVVTNASGPSTPGTIVAHGHNLPGTVSFERGVTVNGGTIQLDGPLSKVQLNGAIVKPDTVVNSSGGTITTVAPSMANTLGGAITNSGGSTIVAAAGTTLTIRPTGSGLLNSAMLRAAAGSTLNVVGGIDGTGMTRVDAGGNLTANHIIQGALVIGGSTGSPAFVAIAASNAGGNPLAEMTSVSTTPVEFGAFSARPPSDPSPDASFGLTPSAVPGHSAAVPEPSSLLLGLLAAIGLSALARHYRVSKR